MKTPFEAVIAHLRNDSDQDQERVIQEWLAENEEHARTLADLREIWEDAQAPAPAQGQASFLKKPSVEEVIARAEAQNLPGTDVARDSGHAPTPGLGASLSRGRLSRVPFRRIAAGALAASLMALGFAVALSRGATDSRQPVLASAQIVTGQGERATVTLGDGATIRVGPGSSIHLLEGPGETVVNLEGRAYFGVQPGTDTPLRVVTQWGEARVLGTRFEVRADSDEFRVLVVDGSVAISSGGEALELRPSELARSIRGGKLETEAVQDVSKHLAWLGNALVFQKTPLHQAAREIEYQYGISVSYDPSLSELTITATFTDASLDDLFAVLCGVIGAECVMDDNRVDMRNVYL